jgi:hypothetical protein
MDPVHVNIVLLLKQKYFLLGVISFTTDAGLYRHDSVIACLVVHLICGKGKMLLAVRKDMCFASFSAES